MAAASKAGKAALKQLLDTLHSQQPQSPDSQQPQSPAA